ncbi:hypothetical protein [Pseudopedobacter sp.]|uniref:hypothetical protein n=1 Tax=Pseudopedobacter sp. TaxID=1936787 RepID=UPI003341CF65
MILLNMLTCGCNIFEPGSPKAYEFWFWLIGLGATLFAIYWSYKTARNTFNEEQTLQKEQYEKQVERDNSIFDKLLKTISDKLITQKEKLENYIITDFQEITVVPGLNTTILLNIDPKSLYQRKDLEERALTELLLELPEVGDLMDLITNMIARYESKQESLYVTLNKVSDLYEIYHSSNIQTYKNLQYETYDFITDTNIESLKKKKKELLQDIIRHEKKEEYVKLLKITDTLIKKTEISDNMQLLSSYSETYQNLLIARNQKSDYENFSAFHNEFIIPILDRMPPKILSEQVMSTYKFLMDQKKAFIRYKALHSYHKTAIESLISQIDRIHNLIGNFIKENTSQA